MSLKLPIWLWIGFGGFLGAIARYTLGSILNQMHTKIPFGTLGVNVIGSFLVGVFTFVLLTKTHLPNELRFFLIVGFLGAFTTFSTFSLETYALYQSGQLITSALNIFLNTTLSILGVIIGMYLSKLLI